MEIPPTKIFCVVMETHYLPCVRNIIEKVNVVVCSLWGNVTIKVYGSFGTGLSIPSSDLDLVIMGVNSSSFPGNVTYI